MMKQMPRLLVISNNCFSETNSNGRILSELLMDYPKENLAQFFIKEGTPDFSICKNYYLVTDGEVLNSLKGKECGKVLSDNYDSNNENKKRISSGKPVSKGVAARIARNWVWKIGRWKNKKLNNWIDSFNPQCVLLQSGDTVFMQKFAYSISVKKQIPLIIFNSEDYYFKSENYLGGGIVSGFLYCFFISNYRKHFDKAIKYAAHSVYMCGSLKELYDSRFHLPSTVIMSSTGVKADLPLRKELGNPPKFSYLGNLGLRRYESLVEVAEALNRINSRYYLDVYGKTDNKKCIEAFENCTAIRYHGFVGYDEVIRIMKQSDFLFHVECFDKEIVKNIKNGFSTKIADSLACGVCFVFFGDKSIEGAKYLIKNKCACVVTDKALLNKKLYEVIDNITIREEYISNALKTVEENHRADKNRRKLESIIYESITD